jgi:CheY-like chemotaxis protein
MIKISKEKAIQVLSIGTKILMKDVMDTYLRSLGEVKTFYAHKLSTALETYKEKKPQIIFCEQSFPEGSALEFIKSIGELPVSGDQYFVLATEAASDELVSLAVEKGIDELLVKPFSTENIHQIVERYFEKSAMAEHDWVKEMRQARQSFRENRFQEAEALFALAARKFPANANVLLEAAEFFLARGNPKQAHGYLETVLQESPDNVRALHLMGQALKKNGHYHEAAQRFLRATALSPMNSLRNGELAETYLFMAEEQIQAALKNENEHPGLILSKARYQLVRKDYMALITYLDAKRAYLSEAAKKEADTIVAIAKKLGGIK